MSADRTTNRVVSERLRTPPPERPEGTRSNYDDLEGDVKAAVGRFVSELWNKHRVEACDEFLAEDFVDHDPYPGQGSGRDGFRAYAAAFLSAFPDVAVTIDDMLMEGSKCAMRLAWTATQTGDYLATAATGRRVEARQMEFVRVVNWRIVERWAVLERPWLTEQLSGPTEGGAAEDAPEISSAEDGRSA